MPSRDQFTTEIYVNNQQAQDALMELNQKLEKLQKSVKFVFLLFDFRCFMRKWFVDYLDSMIDDLEDIKRFQHMYIFEASLIDFLVWFLGFVKDKLDNRD